MSTRQHACYCTAQAIPPPRSKRLAFAALLAFKCMMASSQQTAIMQHITVLAACQCSSASAVGSWRRASSSECAPVVWATPCYCWICAAEWPHPCAALDAASPLLFPPPAASPAAASVPASIRQYSISHGVARGRWPWQPDACLRWSDSMAAKLLWLSIMTNHGNGRLKQHRRPGQPAATECPQQAGHD